MELSLYTLVMENLFRKVRSSLFTMGVPQINLEESRIISLQSLYDVRVALPQIFLRTPTLGFHQFFG